MNNYTPLFIKELKLMIVILKYKNFKKLTENDIPQNIKVMFEEDKLNEIHLTTEEEYRKNREGGVLIFKN